jgi:MFS family permease
VSLKWRSIAVDVTPLRTSRQFRLLWSGQAMSFLGSMLTYVALPYQVFRLTGSSLAVGMLGLSTFVPLLAVGLVGGALADTLDRRRLFFLAETGLAAVSVLLAVNAFLPQPQLWALYLLSGCSGALMGLGRPSLDAMLPRLVAPEQVAAASALTALYGSLGLVLGQLAGGVLVATVGLGATYAIDAATFAASLLTLRAMDAMPPDPDAGAVSLSSIREGLRYVRGNKVVLGTYLLDANAMVFGFPRAVMPALAAGRFGGGAATLGLLYAAPTAGAFVVSATSGWASAVRRHGLAIAIAVAVWGLSIIAFGLTHTLPLALVALAVAGGADMVSGVFRMTIWAQAVPDRYRGRLAGVTLINVTSGEMLGDVEGGAVGAWRGPGFSVVSGGVACLAGLAVCLALLPDFVRYRAGSVPA